MDGSNSRIAIVGAGKVGRALGFRWRSLGHEVVFGVRDPAGERHGDLGEASVPAQAVSGADVILIALPWAAVEAVCEEIDVGDAVVIDATNPRGAASPAGSGAARIAEVLPSQRVVKGFNTTGSGNMADSAYPDGKPLMLLAGDDIEAKKVCSGLASGLGFDPVDAGPIANASLLESMAELWIGLAYQQGNGPDLAFSLLRRTGA